MGVGTSLEGAGHREIRSSVWIMLIEVSVKHPRAWNSRRGQGWSYKVKNHQHRDI